MKLSLSVFSFLVLAALLACAAADDIVALKAALSAICAVNRMGEFGYCCAISNNGQSIATVDSLPPGFGSLVTTSDGTIKGLFVLNLALLFLR